MVKTNDRDAALSALTSYRNRLKRDLLAVERSIELLGSDEKPSAERDEPDLAGYETLKAQEAVRRFLAEREGEWLKPSVIARELLRRSVQTKTRSSFGSVVYAALVREVEKERAERKKKNGRWVFTRKQGSET